MTSAWPLIEYAVSWGAGPNDTPVQDYWCNLTSRTRGKTTVRRGKQYELDQVQPGEMTLTFENLDGAFDPTNTTSPFWPQVKPYRLIRLRAQYPATVNLLTADQATAFYASQGSSPSGALPQWVSALGASQTLACVYSAGIGTNYYSVGINASAQYQGVVLAGWSVAPGVTYSAQCEANSPNGVTAQLVIDWRDVSGNHISYATDAATALPAGQVQLTVTGAAPVNAAGAQLFVQNTTVIASATAMGCWDFQIEAASAPSSWVQPGTWYSLFTGYVERWPQSWSSGGNYGTVAVDCVDLFGFLANAPLRDPFAADLLALDPNFLYELNEASGTTVFQDLTGKRGPVTYVPTSSAGSITAGSSLTSSDSAPPNQANPSLPLTGAFLGASGPVVTSAQPPGALQISSGTALEIPPDPATGMVGVPQSGSWTRIVAARSTNTTSNAIAIALYCGNSTRSLLLGLLSTFGNCAQFVGGGGSQTLTIGLPVLASTSDHDWHLYAITHTIGSLTASVYWDDGQSVSANSTWGDPNPTQGLVAAGASDAIGAVVSGFLVQENWVGDLAFVCELPVAMTASLMRQLNASWRNAWASGANNGAVETSGDRYQRILGWINYTGPTAVDGGAEVAYGPATDIQGGSNPTYALQALQNVVTTEYGQHYIAADGTVTFKARTARYNPTPVVSFGEHAGEVPYLNAAMDFDPTRVGNQVEVDAQYGNAAYFASDAASINDYGQVGIQQTVNSLDPESLQDGAEYLLYQNKQPLQRLAALPVDVGANPSAFAQLLGLDLGTAVTVNRRPSAAPVISQVGYLEQIQWTIGSDRSCQWSAQVSNALAHYFGALDSTAYGRFGADGNTLNAAITSTATSLAIATAAGKAVFSNSSSDYPMNILVDAEQITLTAAPGGLTSPQTFTVTRGANGTTPAAHAAGATVSVVGSLVFGF